MEKGEYVDMNVIIGYHGVELRVRDSELSLSFVLGTYTS